MLVGGFSANLAGALVRKQSHVRGHLILATDN